jgi:hypothetical protein
VRALVEALLIWSRIPTKVVSKALLQDTVSSSTNIKLVLSRSNNIVVHQQVSKALSLSNPAPAAMMDLASLPEAKTPTDPAWATILQSHR